MREGERGREGDEGTGVEGYRQVEFLAEGMGHAMAAADLVVSRAGLSTLTEISALGKPSILIPMPDSHQNANAKVFSRANGGIVLQQRDLDPAKLAEVIRGLVGNPERLAELGAVARDLMPPGAEGRIADELERIKGM